MILKLNPEKLDFEIKNELDKEQHTFFHIREEKDPDQIFWYKNDLLVKKDTIIKKLDFEERKLEFFLQAKENQNMAEYSNELVLMEYENHIITSPEEKATDIKILNIEKVEIFSKSFHETVMPLYIEDNYLFLIDNYLNSPERTYRVNLEDNDIELFEIKEKYSLEGGENIEVLDEENNLLMDIPKVNDIRSFSIHENLKKIALVDTEGMIWIYLKNPD